MLARWRGEDWGHDGIAGHPQVAESPEFSALAADLFTLAPSQKNPAPTPVIASAVAAEQPADGTTRKVETIALNASALAAEKPADGIKRNAETAEADGIKRNGETAEGTSAPAKKDLAPTAVNASALAAEKKAGGNSRKRPAETREPPAIEEDICKGVVRRAAAWRQKYNPSRKKQKLHGDTIGFHMLNRDGIACNGDRCDDLLGQLVHDGTDPDEAQRDNFVVRSSGPDDPSRAFNIEVCRQHPKLALPHSFDPFYFSLSHSHLMQIMRNINHRAQSDVEGITDQEGCLSLALVQQTDQRLARLCSDGFDCEVFPHAMEKEEPESIHDISIAANIKHGTHLMETEMQGLVRLGRVCSAEQFVAQEAMFESVRKKMAATMPKIALSENFVDFFSLAVNLGAAEGPFLNELADFHGQWVNPKIRKLRMSTLGLLGTIPPAIEVDGASNTMAPLIVAIIKAAYASSLEKYLKDEYLEYLFAKDVRINKADVEQMDRLVKALQVLQHFHVTCKEVMDRLSRGQRIQFLGAADVRVANAYLERLEETSQLPAIGFELQSELEMLSPDDIGLPSPLTWFSPVPSAPAAEPLGPKIIQYDGEMRATSGQACRVEQGPDSEVISANVSGKLEADEMFKSEMVLGLLEAFLKFGGASPPGALVEVKRIRNVVSVHAKVDIEVGALLMVPVIRTTQGITMISEGDAAKKWDKVYPLKPGEDGRVWVLVKQAKLPSKKRAKNDNGEKDEVYHAWLAKRVPYEEGANCTVKWCTLSLVTTFGGHHSEAREVPVPIFTNTERILTGEEIKIYAKKEESSVKKVEKVETWREKAKKQESSKGKGTKPRTN